MKSITLRIYLAVVAVLLLFALVAAWVAQRNLDFDREHHRRGGDRERYEALAELVENSMPAAAESPQDQSRALLDLSMRLRVPMALDSPTGLRLATSPPFADWSRRHPEFFDNDDPDDDGGVEMDDAALRDMQAQGLFRSIWADGRTLWLLKSPRTMMGPGPNGPPGMRGPPPPHWLPWMPWLPADLLLVLLLVFVAVAMGAWPVARRLTRRLKALQQGVEHFGEGNLQHRVEVQGKDEVADLAQSFNEAAARIESLVVANRSLLANASHELRSPLARMKMAVSMLSDASAERAEALKQEIHQNIGELDALVEEVLLASRLDAQAPLNLQAVDVAGLLVEEAQRVQAQVHLDAVSLSAVPTVYQLMADEKLLRRAVRNLLENARRYGVSPEGASPVDIRLTLSAQGLNIAVEDRGPGVPPEQRERIFEPFYRLPGHAEHAGGVGLGLSLVRQIAERHGGEVRCEPREGGGSRFIVSLPKK